MSAESAGVVPRGEVSRPVVWLIVAAAVQLGAQVLALGWSTGWRDHGANVTHNTVVVPHDWVVAVATTASVTAWGWAVLQRRPGGRLLRTFICLTLAAALYCTGRVVGDSWSVCATAARSGTTYAVVRRDAVLSSATFLATELSAGAFATEAEIRSSLVCDRDTWPMRIVRPASMAGTGYSVRSTAAGRVLGMYDAACLAAYDPATDTAWSGTQLMSISPLALLGPDDRCNEDDLTRLLAAVRAAAKIGDGHGDTDLVPCDAVLAEDVESTNPSVRDAAAQLIEAGGRAMYPEATQRLEGLR